MRLQGSPPNGELVLSYVNDPNGTLVGQATGPQGVKGDPGEQGPAGSPGQIQWAGGTSGVLPATSGQHLSTQGGNTLDDGTGRVSLRGPLALTQMSSPPSLVAGQGTLYVGSDGLPHYLSTATGDLQLAWIGGFDGGGASSVYGAAQILDGGNASSVYTSSQILNGGGA